MLDVAHSLLESTKPDRFPAERLRFDHKRLKVTIIATFEIDSNEARDEVEGNISAALSSLGARGQLKAGYEVIGG